MKYDSIDQIRGWAIFLVLCNHVAAWVDQLSPAVAVFSKLGQLGVQLFFVASAYTLCLSWFSTKPTSHGVARFYLRRFFRIAPLYYVGIGLFALLHYVGGSSHGGEAAAYPWHAALVNGLFLHGFVPFANNNVVPGGWSIGTEMAFYLLFPGLLVLLLGRDAALAPRRIAWALGLAMALNIGLQSVLIQADGRLENNSFWYFNLVNQLPVFLCGMGLYAMDQRWTHGAAALRTCMVGVAVVFGALLLWVWKGASPLAFAWVPTLAGVAMAAFMGLWMRWAPEMAWLTRLGQQSYAIYVVHTLFAWHGMKALKSAGLLGTGGDLVYGLSLLICLCLSYGLAVLMGRFIETPGQVWGRRVADAWLGQPRAVRAVS